MPLRFNTLSGFVTAFLPRSKSLLISWLQSPSAVILEPRKIKSVTVYIIFPSICHDVMGPDAMIFIFWMLSFKQVFFILFHLHQEALSFLFSFYLKGGVIFISEFIDISPSNLDSSLCFIQPAFCIRYFIYKLNKQGDNVQPWHTLFPFWNQSVACPVLTVASWPAYRFLRRQIKWSSISTSLRILHTFL